MKHNYRFRLKVLLVALVVLLFNAEYLAAQRIFDAATFLTPKSFSTAGIAPQYVAGGDLNSDGLNDLVVSNFGSGASNGSVVVFPNTSVIGDVQLASGITLSTGGGFSEIAIADMDGDGKPEVIVANETGRISVFKNISVQGGPILFEPQFNFLASGEVSRKISIGDLDGDGKPEIVVTNYGSIYVTGCNVTVFKNNSTGAGFNFNLDYTLLPPVRDHVHDARIGDVDGDHKPDILFIATGKIHVFLNQSAAGSLSFVSTLGVNTEGTTLRLADLNNDGKLDVVTQILRGYDGIHVLQNTSSVAGSVSFSGVLLPVGSGVIGLFLGDVDNDNLPDIITSRYENVEVSVIRNMVRPDGLLNQAAFGTAVKFKTNEVGVLGVALTDLDGDQKPEIIGVNKDSGKMSVFANNADVTAPGAPTNVKAKPATISNTISWPASSEPDIKEYKIYGGTTVQPVTLLAIVASNELKYEHTGLTTGTTYYYRITAIDQVNNESTFSNEVSATPSFGPVVNSVLPESGPIGTAVKISGTNFSAIASENVVYFGSVRASITSATATEINVTVPSGASYRKITVININTQLQGSSQHPYRITFNNALGRPFGRNSFIEDPVPQQQGSGFPSDNLDIDGDGKTDLLVNATSKLEIYRNISDPGQEIKIEKVQTITATLRDLATGDLNGDGKPDLVIADYSSRNRIFINKSTPGNISFIEAATTLPGDLPQFVKLTDIDGDGKLDVIAVRENAPIQIYQNLTADVSDIKFAPPLMLATTRQPNSLLVADMDGDLKPDILCTESTVTNKMTIFLNLCLPGVITTAQLARNEIGVTGPFLYMDVADLDGDGKNDILHHLGREQVRILGNRSTPGNLSFPIVQLENIPNDPHRLNFGDFDGNGKLDILIPGNPGIYLLRNKLPGIGLVYDGPVKVGDHNMALFSIADFNNDGKLDFLASDGPGIRMFRNNFDVDAPAAPQDLVVTANRQGHVLSWKANTEPDLDGYKIYWGTTPNPVSLLRSVDAATTTMSHFLPESAETFYYRIRAFDKTDNLSPYSNEVSVKFKLIPTITFAATRSVVFGDVDFDPAGTSTNAGTPITYTSSNVSIATIVNGKIHILKAGAVNIIASQAGDQDHEPALDVIQLLTIAKADQVVAFSAIPDLHEGDPDYTFNVINSSGLPLTFSSSNANVATIVNGKLHVTGTGLALITASNTGDQNYNAVSVDQGLSVLAFPAAVILANGPLEFCVGGNVVLSVNGTASGYKWFREGQLLANETTAQLTASIAGNYRAELTFSNGLVKSATPVLVKTAVVTAGITASKITVQPGENVKLRASGGIRYVWREVGGQGTGAADVLDVAPNQTTTYSLTAYNALGCFDTKTLTITVTAGPVISTKGDLQPNNLLSVNGDGINDIWIIKNIEQYPANQVTIFDKGGRVVYRKRGYANDWDGTYNGSPLNEDTYYYLLDLGNNQALIKGFITLIRDKK